MTCLACAGAWCQDGTIQNSGVISTGANCDCVSRTQSCCATVWIACTWTSVAQSCARISVAASVASASSANSAFTTERSQPARGAGMPGSPNSARSAGVSASASSTETASASISISASLTVSTSSSRQISTSSCSRGSLAWSSPWFSLMAAPELRGLLKWRSPQGGPASTLEGLRIVAQRRSAPMGLSACGRPSTARGSGCPCRLR